MATKTSAAGGGSAFASECRLTHPAPCGVPAPCGFPCELRLGPERHAVVELGSLARLAILAVPGSRGTFREQARELLEQVRCIVSRQAVPLTPTTLMVFLRDASDEDACREIVDSIFGAAAPVTTIVAQPPCCGAALGVELWAVGGPEVQVDRFDREALAVECDGIRWIYAGDVRGDADAPDAYTESFSAFQQVQRTLARAGARFDEVVRTWIYVNEITAGEDGRQRYQELNRARTAYYGDLCFGGRLRAPQHPGSIYPASTGIGTTSTGIAIAAMALQSDRPDVFILPLENPGQTPAYDYHVSHSPESPKFSRAMAVVQGHFVSILVSGTASIVDSLTVHVGDAARQTKQTLENIQRLIASENLARHGLPGVAVTLRDVAKLRVYVKHARDYEACRAVVEDRLPGVPAIYLHTDVCRPDLLVEIEAVAFAPVAGNAAR
ncbi:MAG: hypothetical protein KA004_06755 [Verrucomicrobiales bacterium]|nr:hypothetical protein [Verrucomicrobiales bacterium]